MKKKGNLVICCMCMVLLANIFASISFAGPGLPGAGRINNPPGREPVQRKLEIDSRVRTGADFILDGIIAERRNDGTLFLEVLTYNRGSAIGPTEGPVPVYLYYGHQKIGEASLAAHYMRGVSIGTTRAFPHDRRIRLRVVVDPRDIIAETNETNNACTIELAARETLVSNGCH